MREGDLDGVDQGGEVDGEEGFDVLSVESREGKEWMGVSTVLEEEGRGREDGKRGSEGGREGGEERRRKRRQAHTSTSAIRFRGPRL